MWQPVDGGTCSFACRQRGSWTGALTPWLRARGHKARRRGSDSYTRAYAGPIDSTCRAPAPATTREDGWALGDWEIDAVGTVYPPLTRGKWVGGWVGALLALSSRRVSVSSAAR